MGGGEGGGGARRGVTIYGIYLLAKMGSQIGPSIYLVA